MIGENGAIAVIREAESIDYLQANDKIPEWLG
jgi:hypothetical protein